LAAGGAGCGGSAGVAIDCGGENAFLTRGSAGFVEFANEPPTPRTDGGDAAVAGGAAGGAVLAIAANAERIEAASGGFALLVGADSINELGTFFRNM
jgi:hypothetical protein